MKNTLAISAILTAFTGSAWAEDHTNSPLNGFVQLNMNSADYDYPDGDWDGYSPFEGGGVEAALSYSLGNGRSLTVEASSMSLSDITGDYDVSITMGAIHMNWDLGIGKVGVFGGIMTASDYYDAPTSEFHFVGLEGQTWVNDQILLQGDVTSIQLDSGYYEMGNDVANFGLGMQYFPEDNLMIGASLGLLTGQLGYESDEVNALRWEVETAYQYDAVPLALFASVSGINDTTWLDDPSANGVLMSTVGVRWVFGGGTLKTQSESVNQVSDLSTVPWMRLDGNW
jgi:hypothetical protein